MTKFIVHLFREMRITFGCIDADSPEAAAAIAQGKPTEDADDIADCDGETFYACVDVQSDENYEQSRWIDFDPERERQAAAKLLAALKACELQLREYVRWHHAHAGGCSVEIESAWEQARDAIVEADAVGIRVKPATPAFRAVLEAVLPYAEGEAYSLDKHKDSPEAEAEAERAWTVIEAARAALTRPDAGEA